MSYWYDPFLRQFHKILYHLFYVYDQNILLLTLRLFLFTLDNFKHAQYVYISRIKVHFLRLNGTDFQYFVDIIKAKVYVIKYIYICYLKHALLARVDYI